MAADSYNVNVNSPDTSDYSIYCDIKVRIQQRKYLKSVENLCSILLIVTRPAPLEMAHSYRLGLVTWRYPVRIPVGPDICHRGFAVVVQCCTVLQTVQRHKVCSAVYDDVHYKEPFKLFEIRIGHSSGFLLSRYCLNVQKAT